MFRMRIYIICPVRQCTASQAEEIAKYVKDLEKDGYQVYWPMRDTRQNDPIGNRICNANRKAIKTSDEVHVYYDSKSSGSLFDLGIAYGLEKPVRLINEVQATDGKKGFNNFLRSIDRNVLDELDM